MKRDKDAAFRDFFVAESDSLRRLGTFLTGDPDKGAELAQEALLRTYRAWDRIVDGNPAYARRTLVNLVRSAHRRRLVAMKHAPAPAEPTPSAAPAVDDWIVMRDALQSLTPVRRATVVLRFYEDLEEAEIAAILDRPVGSVKSDLHRAKKQLRRLLEHQKPTLRQAAAATCQE